MAVDRRRANRDWYVSDGEGSLYASGLHGQILATLMDLRDGLQEVVRQLGAINGNTTPLRCPNAVDIPNILRRIDKNTRKPKRRKVAKK